ncbi:MAG: universal stress protein [Cytophagales bacterium]|nr:universal stress protein [Cytophagales bacterium]
MIKNIVVPFDFSKASFQALAFTSKLAMKFKAKVHLVAIQDPGIGAPSTNTHDNVLGALAPVQYNLELAEENEMKEKLIHIMREQVFPTIQGKISFIFKDFYNAFEHFTTENKVDLVVVGAEKEDSFWEHFTGSLTQDLIQNTNIPLLNIGKEQSIEMTDVLIFTDLSTEIPERLLQVSRLFQHEGARLHLANVIESELLTKEEVTDKLVEYAWANQLGRPKYHVKKNADFMEGFHEIVQETNPDMILMKTYDKSAFRSFFEGRLAQKVMQQFDVPVLVEKV